MHAVEIVTDDNVLLQRNISVDTSDLIDYIRKASRIWTDPDVEVYENTGFINFKHQVDFKNKYWVDFAEVLTEKGFCYSSNIVDAAEMFRLEK